MSPQPGAGAGEHVILHLAVDVRHEDFLPDLCAYLRARGQWALIPTLRLWWRTVADHAVAESRALEARTDEEQP